MVASGQSPETLLLLQHPPVITLGKRASPANILWSTDALAKAGISVARATRGGDVTYHGPGQLVGYPIFRVGRAVRAHVSAIASAVIAALDELGVRAEWRESCPGVWVGDDKICAVGIQIRRGIAMHGFALNVDLDLAVFAAIVPCGLRHAGVTSMAKQVARVPPIEDLAGRVALKLGEQCGREMVEILASSSRLQIANGSL